MRRVRTDAPRAALCAAVAAVALCAACAEQPTMEVPHRTSAAAPAPLTAATPMGIVEALQRDGLNTGNPVDATAAECPSTGCTMAVTTDRFTIWSFAGTGAAETFAGSRNLRQVENVVVAFAPATTPGDQDLYWSAIIRAVR